MWFSTFFNANSFNAKNQGYVYIRNCYARDRMHSPDPHTNQLTKFCESDGSTQHHPAQFNHAGPQADNAQETHRRQYTAFDRNHPYSRHSGLQLKNQSSPFSVSSSASSSAAGSSANLVNPTSVRRLYHVKSFFISLS